jgi:enoyl-CoA hydratase/carnithine racemase
VLQARGQKMIDLSTITLSSGFIRAERFSQDRLVLITLDRISCKNALNLAMYEDMVRLFEGLTGCAQTRAIVMTGAGGCFTSGNDLGDFASAGVAGVVSSHSSLWRFMVCLRDCPIPVVMAVDGLAIGIGVTMLLHADAVFTTERSTFAMPFAKLGLCPEYASSFLLPRLAGYFRAAEWLMLGETFSAKAAFNGQLVNGIAVDALQAALEYANKLAQMPVEALRVTKMLLRSGDKKAVVLAMENEAEHFKKALAGPEFGAALAAFFNKR